MQRQQHNDAVVQQQRLGAVAKLAQRQKGKTTTTTTIVRTVQQPDGGITTTKTVIKRGRRRKGDNGTGERKTIKKVMSRDGGTVGRHQEQKHITGETQETNHPPKVVKRIVRRKVHRSPGPNATQLDSSHDRVNEKQQFTQSVSLQGVSSKPGVSQDGVLLQQHQLEDEIRRVEAAIAAKNTNAKARTASSSQAHLPARVKQKQNQQNATTEESKHLEEEIRQIEAAIATENKRQKDATAVCRPKNSHLPVTDTHTTPARNVMHQTKHAHKQGEHPQQAVSLDIFMQQSPRRAAAQGMTEAATAAGNNANLRHKAVKRFVRKAHQAPRTMPAGTTANYTPAGESPEAQQAAKAAALHRKQIEDEIRQLELQIGAERKRKIKNVVKTQNNVTKSVGASHDPAEAARLQLEEEIRQMEAAIEAAKQQQQGPHKKNKTRSTGQHFTPDEEAAISEYKKMTKIGLPEIAIFNCMIRDGVSDKVQRAVLGADNILLQPPENTGIRRGSKPQVQQATPSAQTAPVSSSLPPELGSFLQMKKLGLPEGAILHAMNRAGIPSDMHHLVFSEGGGAPAPTRRRRKRKSQAHPVPSSLHTGNAPAPAVPVSNSLPSELEPFLQMKKIGLPEGAVLHAMHKAGIPPDKQQLLLPENGSSSGALAPKSHRKLHSKPISSTSGPQTSSIEPLSAQEEVVVKEYQKMLKLKLPKQAILHRMCKEGASDKIKRAVLGTQAVSKNRKNNDATIKPLASAHHLTAPSRTDSKANLLASIQGAAFARDQRVQSGNAVMQDIAPEVKVQPRDTQLSFAFAEQVSQMARARDARLLAGGEKKMTKIKNKEDYRKDLKSIFIEAAELGRLTRLSEYVVEATASEKTKEEEWRSSGLLAIQWRSNHMSVIHEAARVGNEIKLREKVVGNHPEYEEGMEYDEDEEEQNPRLQQLMELNKRAGAGQHKVEKLMRGRKQNQERVDLLVRPMYCYINVDEVKLPKTAPPRFDPNKIKQKLAKRPTIDIGNEAATAAWERRARLDRPNSMPKITGVCACPYCENASPFQTYAYRLKEKQQKGESSASGHGRHQHNLSR